MAELAFYAVVFVALCSFVAVLFAAFLEDIKPKVKQTCWIYCPECGKDLCSIRGVKYTDTDYVRYTCTCEFKSTWDFDSYPVPIWISDEPMKGKE